MPEQALFCNTSGAGFVERVPEAAKGATKQSEAKLASAFYSEISCDKMLKKKLSHSTITGTGAIKPQLFF
jgi:hypothetical protein